MIVVLVLYHNLDEGAGAVANDLSGLGNNGAITLPSWLAGKYGKCLNFNTTSFVTVPHNAGLTFTAGDFTVAFWLYTANRDNNGGVMVCKGEYVVDGWYIQNNNATGGTFNFTSNQLGTFQQIFSNVGVIVNNTWVFITVVKSGATVTLYANGVDVTAGGGPFPITNPVSSTRNLIVAGYVDGSDPTFNYFGALDEVRIFNTALSQADVQALYDLYPVRMVLTGNINYKV